MRWVTIFCRNLPHSGTEPDTNLQGGTKCSIRETKLPTAELKRPLWAAKKTRFMALLPWESGRRDLLEGGLVRLVADPSAVQDQPVLYVHGGAVSQIQDLLMEINSTSCRRKSGAKCLSVLFFFLSCLSVLSLPFYFLSCLCSFFNFAFLFWFLSWFVLPLFSSFVSCLCLLSTFSSFCLFSFLLLSTYRLFFFLSTHEIVYLESLSSEVREGERERLLLFDSSRQTCIIKVLS